MVTCQKISLHCAKVNKKDEFYTLYKDIENELINYKNYFKNKIIYCNCDEPEKSNFWKYFELNFVKLGLKKLIATHFEPQAQSYKYELTKVPNVEDGICKLVLKKEVLKENGDFRSQECLELLKKTDIVVTNPPFSLFREYVEQLVSNDKKFIIIGNQNAITYKDIFKLIKERKLWLGQSIHSGDREFKVPEDYPFNALRFGIDENGNRFIRVKGVRWFTNLNYEDRYKDLVLNKKYDESKYQKYDNYDAINVNRTKAIPSDYTGIMGVPITFLDKYNPKQFEIIGLAASTGYDKDIVGLTFLGEKDARPQIDGKTTYARIFIRKVQNCS